MSKEGKKAMKKIAQKPNAVNRVAYPFTYENSSEWSRSSMSEAAAR